MESQIRRSKLQGLELAAQQSCGVFGLRFAAVGAKRGNKKGYESVKLPIHTLFWRDTPGKQPHACISGYLPGNRQRRALP